MQLNWEERDEVVGHDALGINGESLFADPLQVRKGSQKYSLPPGPQSRLSPPEEHYEPEATEHTYREPPPKEGGNAVVKFFKWMAAGGAECCSMRDRTKESEESKSKFPDFGIAERPVRASPRQASSSTPPGNAANRRGGRGGSDSDSDNESSRGTGHKGWPGGHAEQQSWSGSPAPAPAASTPPLSGPLGQANRGGAGLITRWEWPKWCLDGKEPCIQVYVIDEDSGKKEWLDGVPQSRVVDKNGRDAYLAVEYEFEEEFYMQDFGPQHVRRRGEEETVLEMFEKKNRSGGGYSDLDNTRLAPGRGNRGFGP